MGLLIGENILGYILGILAWITGGPFFILLFLVYLIYCAFVHLLAKLFRPDLLAISRIDALVAFAPSYSDDSFIHICQVWKVKGELSVESFRNHFNNVFLATEQDRKIYVNLYCYFVNFLGYTFKKKVNNLDLNYHIQEEQLKEGESVESFLGKWIVSHEEVNLSGEKKPDWMIKIIFDPINSSTTVLFKLHHGLCDGYTGVHLVGKLTGEEEPYTFKDPPPTFSKLLRCFIQTPYIAGRLWYKLFQYKRNIQFYKKSQMKMVEGNGNDKEEWLMSFVTLDLQTVKAIRRLTETNFSSVLMCLQVGVLKRLMYDLSDQRLTMGNGSDEIYIGHSVGWPCHPVMTKGRGMGNHASMSTIKGSLTTADSLQRLLELDQDFQNGKEIGYPELVYYFLMTMFKLQPSFISRLLMKLDINTLGAPETCLSGLLCSNKPHFLLGHPVENLYSPAAVTSLFRGAKLAVRIMSNSDRIDISLFASNSLVKSQENLDKMAKIYFPMELEELERQVGTKTILIV